MLFNINCYVKVKLNKDGRQLMRNNGSRPPKEDSDGWSRWQMWSLMEMFGPHISLGGIVPFDTEIDIVENLDAEEHF